MVEELANYRYGVLQSVCLVIRLSQATPLPALHSIPMGEPFACVGMDFKEMDQSFDKNHYALVLQGY